MSELNSLPNVQHDLNIPLAFHFHFPIHIYPFLTQRYSALFDYGMPSNGAPIDPNDPDSHLVPRLVERVALPLLVHVIKHVWQPASPTGTRRVLAAVEEVMVYLEPSADAAVQLIEGVEERIKAAVDETEVRGECWWVWGLDGWGLLLASAIWEEVEEEDGVP